MRRAYADVQEVSKRLGVWRASTGRSAARRAVGGEGVSRRVPCEGKQQRLDRQLVPEQDDLVRAPSSAPICTSARPAEARDSARRRRTTKPRTTSRVREGEGIEPPAKPTAQTANRVSEPHGTRTRLQPLLIRSPVAAAGHQRRAIYGTHKPPARLLQSCGMIESGLGTLQASYSKRRSDRAALRLLAMSPFAVACAGRDYWHSRRSSHSFRPPLARCRRPPPAPAALPPTRRPSGQPPHWRVRAARSPSPGCRPAADRAPSRPPRCRPAARASASPPGLAGPRALPLVAGAAPPPSRVSERECSLPRGASGRGCLPPRFSPRRSASPPRL